MTAQKAPNRLAGAVAFLSRYVTFPSPDYAVVGALWAAATHLWPSFDAFPYLVITADTKRAGKTRFAECLSFVCANAMNMAGMTAAAVFRSIRDEQPTMFMDEAETLSSEAASTLRAVLNVGYRRGQTIPRMGKGGIEQWPAYCPKAFILIGDVYDTLTDRSVIVRMRRGEAPSRFLFDVAQADGNQIRDELHDELTDRKQDVMDAYAALRLPFLTDRDEELWLPLFAVCRVLAPDRVDDLTRIAVDMATEKTSDRRRYVDLAGAEKDMEQEEYRLRLIRDLLAVMGSAKWIYSTDALTHLHATPTMPWRKFRGTGLDAMDLANLLAGYGVKPRSIKSGTKAKGTTVRRGYRREDILKALAAHGDHA